MALVGICGLGAMSTAYLMPQVARYASANSLRAVAVKTRSLVLTYDDGPGPTSTPALLCLLREHHARGTFFLLGRAAELHADLVDQLLAGGHEIGCHTYHHYHAWKVNPWCATRDIAQGYAALSRWIPSDAIFRPPYGKLNLATWWELRRRGADTHLWTADSGDTCAQLPAARQVVDEVQRAGGGVVLMHDFDRGIDRRQFVLDVTSSLLAMAVREGMTVKTLGELCPTRQ